MSEAKLSFTDKSRVKFSQSKIEHSQKSIQRRSISKKYCLNKPEMMKEFKNSKLFRSTFNSQFLKSYSPRYTYNQKSRNFQKENTQFVQTQYDIDYSSIQNFKQLKPTQTQKFALLKKKLPKTFNLNTQRSLSPNDHISQISNNNQFIRSVFKENQDPIPTKSAKQKSILKKISLNKSPSTTNPNFQSLTAKNIPQKIKKYIRTNPMNYPLQKQDNIKGKINLIKNIIISTSRKKTQKAQSEQLGLSIFNSKLIKSSKILNDTNSKNCLQFEQKKQELFKSLQEEIDKLYDIINQLRLLGYAQQKVNEWVWVYCENNKKFLQSILFKAQAYKASLAEHKIIYKLQEIDLAKTNSKKFKRIINHHEIPLQSSDISDITNHLEEILISKQYFQLKRIQTQIQDTSYAIKNNYLDMQDEKAQEIMKLITNFDKKKKLKPMEYYETLNFYQDAKRLETHFGKVKGLTSANKRKCQNLTEVQIEIIRNKK